MGARTLVFEQKIHVASARKPWLASNAVHEPLVFEEKWLPEPWVLISKHVPNLYFLKDLPRFDAIFYSIAQGCGCLDLTVTSQRLGPYGAALKPFKLIVIGLVDWLGVVGLEGWLMAGGRGVVGWRLHKHMSVRIVFDGICAMF